MELFSLLLTAPSDDSGIGSGNGPYIAIHEGFQGVELHARLTF